LYWRAEAWSTFFGCTTNLTSYNLVVHTKNASPVQLETVLSPAEASEFIDFAANSGFSSARAAYPPSYRNNDRLVVDDDVRAQWLFRRIQSALPAQYEDSLGAMWDLVGLNSRFRFCRYRAGQEFTIHRDGAHFEDENTRSFLTVMLYLNSAEEFAGGLTRFYEDRDISKGSTFEVAPRQGAAVIFGHHLWHDGAPVTEGCKYIMRTDVMFRRRRSIEHRGHNGYVWSVTDAGGAQYASGGRDKTVRIWEGDQCVQILRGHGLSVTTVGSNGKDRLWAGCRDGSLKSWQRIGDEWRETGDAVAHRGVVVTSTDAHDGRFATGGADGVVAVWNVDGGLIESHARHDSWVWGLAWSDSGSLYSVGEDGAVVGGGGRVEGAGCLRALALRERVLVTGNDLGLLTQWTCDLRKVRSWHGHRGAVTALAFLSPRRLVSASEDGRVLLWDMTTGEVVHHWAFTDYVRDLAVRSDGSVLCAGYDGTVRVLNWGSKDE
jgi:WD40 repeat protein